MKTPKRSVETEKTNAKSWLFLIRYSKAILAHMFPNAPAISPAINA